MLAFKSELCGIFHLINLQHRFQAVEKKQTHNYHTYIIPIICHTVTAQSLESDSVVPTRHRLHCRTKHAMHAGSVHQIKSQTRSQYETNTAICQTEIFNSATGFQVQTKAGQTLLLPCFHTLQLHWTDGTALACTRTAADSV